MRAISKAFSKYFGKDIRRDEINKYKSENSKIVSLLEELATYKVEIIYDTLFDFLDDNLALQLIDKQLNELFGIIENNQLIIKEVVEEAIELVNESISELKEELKIVSKKIDILLPKKKRNVR